MTTHEIPQDSPHYHPDLLLISRRKGGPPERLYAEGDLALLLPDVYRVAVVGSRAATMAGKEYTYYCVGRFVESGCVVVSGLANGTDTNAHDSTIEYGGKTIAVMATPLKNTYPPENIALRDRILRSGGLVLTPFPEDASTCKYSFIYRNHIMAAISNGAMVIEGGSSSGCRHLVGTSLEMNKPVVFSPVSDIEHGWISSSLRDGAKRVKFIDRHGSHREDELLDSVCGKINTRASERIR